MKEAFRGDNDKNNLMYFILDWAQKGWKIYHLKNVVGQMGVGEKAQQTLF